MEDLEESFVWGFLAGISVILLQQASRTLSDKILAFCMKPSFSLKNLRLLHIEDQQAAAQEANADDK